MDRAVQALDAYLQTKTVHATRDIQKKMMELSNDSSLFSNEDAQQDFGQKCRNFEIYSDSMDKTSWGRKVFEKWWNVYDDVPPWEEQTTKTVHKPSKPKVIDMFTRKDHMKMGQDFAVNDAAAEEGRYLGVLPKYASVPMRDHAEDLARRRAQIDALMVDFTSRWEGYFFMVVGALTTLGADIENFDPEKQELFVDEDGHCWMVERKVKEE